jgi:hypothetical protein
VTVEDLAAVVRDEDPGEPSEIRCYAGLGLEGLSRSDTDLAMGTRDRLTVMGHKF